MDERDVLREAAKILMRDGWCQGTEVNSQGEVCVDRALAVAANGNSSSWWPALERVKRWLKTNGMLKPGSMLYQWNDDPSRTAEDVILALKLAAEED